ncbi:MAG: hypothetical protein M3O46_15960 [Myxococcota bacterium]|nr:hypothetical protein [Myxococcota bacterium]
MKARLVTGCLTALVIGAIGSVAMSSNAGSVDKSFFCFKATDGSGHCMGSLRGLRSTATATDFGGFVENANDTLGASNDRFFVHFSGQFYICDAKTPLVRALWPVASASRAGFFIEWDATGTCTDLEIQNQSQFYEKFD